MVAIARRDGGEMIGDLAVRAEWDGRSAEIGYNLAAAHQGLGYAQEAAGALVDHLFGEVGVQRVQAMLHPENVASAQVLERLGFVYEGHTRSSYWVGDDCSDNAYYGMLAAERAAWLARPRNRPAKVSFVEVTPENLGSVYELATHESQRRFVSSVPKSFADALVPETVNGKPAVPWFRAVEADGDLAGFVMLAEMTDRHPDPFLWRLLVDRRHQRRGIGGQILDLVVERSRAQGSTRLVTSWVPGRGSPQPFYLAYGFEPTGEILDGETVGALRL
jgi:RimJ/RimL family protein N-acetyltransferase